VREHFLGKVKERENEIQRKKEVVERKNHCREREVKHCRHTKRGSAGKCEALHRVCGLAKIAATGSP